MICPACARPMTPLPHPAGSLPTWLRCPCGEWATASGRRLTPAPLERDDLPGTDEPLCPDPHEEPHIVPAGDNGG